MKLTRNMKRVLNRIIEDERDYPHCIQFETNDYPYYFALHDKSIHVDSVLEELEKQGALTIVDREKWTIQLTEAGRHYKEFIRQEWRAFLLKSILVPIAVSCITTLTTLLIKTGMKQWL